MSLYVKAWFFMGWTILILVTMPMWEPILKHLFGPGGTQLGLIIWAAHGIGAYFLFACPECGCSLFKTEGSFFNARHPWPNKKCSRCRRDHSA